jgi:hypothetical protein
VKCQRGLQQEGDLPRSFRIASSNGFYLLLALSKSRDRQTDMLRIAWVQGGSASQDADVLVG